MELDYNPAFLANAIAARARNGSIKKIDATGKRLSSIGMNNRAPKMSDITFNLKPVDEKPSRKYRKGSKYDSVLDAFIEGTDNLVAVNVTGKDANYLRMQLNKRIEARKLASVEVSVVNNVAYLEK